MECQTAWGPGLFMNMIEPPPPRLDIDYILRPSLPRPGCRIETRGASHVRHRRPLCLYLGDHAGQNTVPTSYRHHLRGQGIARRNCRLVGTHVSAGKVAARPRFKPGARALQYVPGFSSLPPAPACTHARTHPPAQSKLTLASLGGLFLISSSSEFLGGSSAASSVTPRGWARGWARGGGGTAGSGCSTCMWGGAACGHMSGLTEHVRRWGHRRASRQAGSETAAPTQGVGRLGTEAMHARTARTHLRIPAAGHPAPGGGGRVGGSGPGPQRRQVVGAVPQQQCAALVAGGSQEAVGGVGDCVCM